MFNLSGFLVYGGTENVPLVVGTEIYHEWRLGPKILRDILPFIGSVNGLLVHLARRSLLYTNEGIEEAIKI